MEVHGKDPKKVVGLTVTLQEVNLFTTGLFGCEASAEESFHTALVRKQMTVLGKISQHSFDSAKSFTWSWKAEILRFLKLPNILILTQIFRLFLRFSFSPLF